MELEISPNIKVIFNLLRDSFDNISMRNIWCDVLENLLSDLEGKVVKCDKYLSWHVSTIRDVFAYNFAEVLTREHLNLLEEGIGILYKGDCTKELFESYHSRLLESGLCLLPTSQKAIDRYGE